MRLENKNENYCATIVKVHNKIALKGLDNLVGVPMFGQMAIVSKNDDFTYGVFFTSETQLSDSFCSANNLYRHSELNSDKNATGYINDDRRVRALKLRGNVSSGLLLPLEAFYYLGVDITKFKEGDSFTHIDGVEICRKYVIKVTTSSKNKQQVSKTKVCRIENKLMPEHLDSANYWKNEFLLEDDDWIVVSQKLHGTSARFTNQICTRKFSFLEKVAKFFGVKVNDKEYDYFAGSRRVIKDVERKTMNHFYSDDIWNKQLDKIQHVIPKNYVLYGEIIGWVNENSPIQENYTYDLKPGEFSFYVYRISVVNPDGVCVDLSWDAMAEFCRHNGLNMVPEIWRGRKKDFDVSLYMDKKFTTDMNLPQCVPLSSGSPCDEGVIVRREGIKPLLLKAKSPLFLAHETKQLDTGKIDVESMES